MSRTLKINIPARNEKVYLCYIEQRKLYPLYKYTEIIKMVAVIQGLGFHNCRKIVESH